MQGGLRMFLKKIVEIVWMWGLWLAPIVLAGLCWAYGKFRPGTPPEDMPWKLFLLITGCVCLYCYSQNILYPVKNETSDKISAMYPPVDPFYLTREPAGIIFGRPINSKNRFIVKKLKTGVDGHVLCIGGSGSGKSSCLIIPTLLCNNGVSAFVMDIKGELINLTNKIDDPSIVVVDFTDRSSLSYGWDPLWRLHDNPSDQEIYDTMRDIVSILVPINPAAKEPMWANNARLLMTGLLIGVYKQGKHNIVDIVDVILGNSTKELAKKIVAAAGENSIEKRLLAEYPETADETLSGFVSEYKIHLAVFNDADVRYSFKVNPKKADPSLLEQRKKIFLVMPEHRLVDYYDLTQLCVQQVLRSLSQRPPTSQQCMFVLDELPRLCAEGKIAGLLDAVHTLRSRQASLGLLRIGRREEIRDEIEEEQTRVSYRKEHIQKVLKSYGFSSVGDFKRVEDKLTKMK